MNICLGISVYYALHYYISFLHTQATHGYTVTYALLHTYSHAYKCEPRDKKSLKKKKLFVHICMLNERMCMHVYKFL